ncbi:MAG: bacitracin synthetase 3 [Amycolatopsis sp.]|nr:bacitracin synthetase 3 [Amycolatopsis sp.]
MSHEHRPFTRAVAPFEQWSLAYPRELAPVLSVCVEGFGVIDPSRLRKAVAIASEACPGARLRRRRRYWVDSEVTPSVHVVRGRSLNPSALHEIPELRAALPDALGANCEVVLFEGTNPTVVFRASHSVMDAHGLMLWAEDVFRAQRGEKPVGARSEVTVVDLGDPLYLSAADDKREQELPALLGVPDRPVPNEYLWRRRTIDGTFPALTAQVAAAIVEIAGAPVVPIGFPVDLRPFHPEVGSTSNLSITISLDIEAGCNWERIYEQLLGVLAERRGNVHAPGPEILRAPLPILRSVIRASDRRIVKRDRMNFAAGVNNIGKIDPAAFSADGFEAAGVYLLSPREPGAAVALVLTEGKGRTDITLSWWDSPRMGERADRLLDHICDTLAAPENRSHSSMSAPEPPETGLLKPDRGVVQQFRDQARAHPEAIAISGPEGDITYAELDKRARVVARELRARGIGRDMVVGLLADKTVAAVAGAWGVLMAGAAYLPMDSKHPDGRVRTLLEDARSPVCLTQRPHDTRDFLPDGCTRIVLDDLPFDVEPRELDYLPLPGDLAYVVYTSGSTGKPKGVEIEHSSLSNYASWATREHGIDASTRLPLLCSLSFDVAEISLILPLLVGGTLLLMRDEISHLSIQEVLDNGATMLSLTPSHLDLITRLELKPRGVKTLIVIGEQFTRSVAARAQVMFGPECRVINLYGPAEATIGVSHHFFTIERDTGAAVPIGVPQDGVSFHLLDPERRFVAPGEPGELYIGGNQLARGYRGRPDLTRERFVRMADGSRVYRTGDIARRLPPSGSASGSGSVESGGPRSGAFEFCGRIDDQLKVHGHRIEPAEIAQTLETHPAVGSAVVVARSRKGHRDKALCGYIVAVEDVETAELEAYLAERLPDYMVPAVIVKLDEIPRSVNGKVAAGSLPDPFAVEGEQSIEPAKPLDDVEATVVKIWSRVLDVDVDTVTGSSDFHRMGGDSLSLITMVAEVARQVVGPSGEKAFTLHMPQIIRRATVEHVASLARLSKG